MASTRPDEVSRQATRGLAMPSHDPVMPGHARS
jgi:hypothetical protein